MHPPRGAVICSHLARGEVSPRCIPPKEPGGVPERARLVRGVSAHGKASRVNGVSPAHDAGKRALETKEEGGELLPAASPQKEAAPRSERRQRQKGAFVRLTQEERESLEARARAAGLSLAAYLRVCALGDAGPRAQRSPTIERELAAQAVAQLNKAGSNLNQIARAVNMKTWPDGPHIVEAADAVKLAALHLLRSFGFKTHDRQGQSSQ